jgi:hypothetical protein
MIRACLLVALSFALAACNPCNRDGCDAVDKPAADSGKSAIAGVVVSESDVVSNGCQDCPFASAPLAVWAAPAPVTDVESARAIVHAGPAAATLDAEGRYQQALDPGSYLLCAFPSTYNAACVSVSVIAGHVTPVNLKLLDGPFRFVVFDPQTRAQVSATTLQPGP